MCGPLGAAVVETIFARQICNLGTRTNTRRAGGLAGRRPAIDRAPISADPRAFVAIRKGRARQKPMGTGDRVTE